MAEAKRSAELNRWLEQFSSYEREFKQWNERGVKILKRYKDQRTRLTDGVARFNILWSNVQILLAATFARIPKADVYRRHRDTDPVGRVAALIVERAVDYDIEHYPDFKATLTASILDRRLGGRGTSWIRYEPHMKQPAAPSGDSVTSTIDAAGEELDYECATIDYVNSKDFGHSVARTWDEVDAVWRVVYMTEEAAEERFPGKAVPVDAYPGEQKGVTRVDGQTQEPRAKVYEIAHKPSKTAIWLHKELGVLDTKPDPWGVEEFFPCPQPLYATLTTDSLIPTPDFTLYQDQAAALDVLCDRIDGLVRALKVAGVYDASIPELARLFTEAGNGDLIPAKNWAAFAEKNGLQGSISLVDLAPIAAALQQAYIAFEQCKGQIYEITGIADIIRGATKASETLGAQELKSNNASLRLKSGQDETAWYATQIIRLKAQVMMSKFDPAAVARMAAVDQLSEVDQPLIGPAMELLFGPRLADPAATAPNPVRAFRIDIAADSMILLDEQQEKAARVEFLNASGQFLQQAGQILATAGPATGPVSELLMELLKFGASAFRSGRNIEGVFDATAAKLKALAAQPQPPAPPDPAVEKEKLVQQGATEERAMKERLDTRKQDLDAAAKGADREQTAQLERERMAHENQRHANEMSKQVSEGEADRSAEAARQTPDMAKLEGHVTDLFAQQKDDAAAQTVSAVEELRTQVSEMGKALAALAGAIARPRRSLIKRGPDGRVAEITEH